MLVETLARSPLLKKEMPTKQVESSLEMRGSPWGSETQATSCSIGS
jgi:hypothetical protein